MSSLLESLGLRQDVVLVAFAAVGLCLFVVYEWMRKGKTTSMSSNAWRIYLTRQSKRTLNGRLLHPSLLSILTWMLRNLSFIGLVAMDPITSPWEFESLTGTIGLRWTPTFSGITISRSLNSRKILMRMFNMLTTLSLEMLVLRFWRN
jgi:hypothetical protein